MCESFKCAEDSFAREFNIAPLLQEFSFSCGNYCILHIIASKVQDSVTL